MMFKDIDEEFSFIKAKFENKFIYANKGPLAFQDNRIFLFEKITRINEKECTIKIIDSNCKSTCLDADINGIRWDEFFSVIKGA